MRERQVPAKSLEKLVGIPDSTISNWISNRNLPNGEALMVLADFFGVSTDYLLCRTNVRQQPPLPPPPPAAWT